MQDLMIRTWLTMSGVVDALADRVASTPERLRDQRGQTAAEYLGIIVLVGLIFVAIFQLNLQETIANKIKEVVDAIANSFSG
jgi:Flp pilus assembly pilin Flp